jgi:hypothetical protein
LRQKCALIRRNVRTRHFASILDLELYSGDYSGSEHRTDSAQISAYTETTLLCPATKNIITVKVIVCNATVHSLHFVVET